MSNTYDFNPNNTTTTDNTRPQHHVHDSSEPLPGTKGGAPTVDYSPDNMENMSQRLPGLQPNRYGQDTLGETEGTMATPASAQDQPQTMGQMGIGSENKMGESGQSLPRSEERNRFGQESQGSLGEHGNNTPMPGSMQHLSGQPAPARVGFEEGVKGSEYAGMQNTTSARGPETMYSERPLDEEGGRGRDDVPTGKVGFSDKMIGKTQKVMGKLGNNAEVREKGELREMGGKAAVDARVHD